MKINLTGLHINVTEAMKEFAKKKVDKLTKFFEPGIVAHVTFDTKKNVQMVNIRIEYKSKTYIADVETDDIYYGIEKCVEIIEGQARKERDKNEKFRHEEINNEKRITEEDIEE